MANICNNLTTSSNNIGGWLTTPGAANETVINWDNNTIVSRPSSTLTYTTSGYSFKNCINPKHGDLFIDMNNMDFKVYDDEKGWLECELEFAGHEFIGNKKHMKFIISREVSIVSIKEKRKNRKVITEKVKYNGDWSFFGSSTTSGTGSVLFGGLSIATGTNNLTIGNGTNITNGTIYLDTTTNTLNLNGSSLQINSGNGSY